MTTRAIQLTKLLIRILITAGLLLWVFSQIDLQQFRHTAKTARWQFLIGVWALTVLFFLIGSIKLQLILRKQGCDLDIATIFGSSAVTALYSMIIPGILSAGIKWYILKKGSGKGSNVLSSMLYNQLSLLLVMTVFGLIALIVTNPASLLSTDTGHQRLLPVICGVLLSAIVLISLLLLNRRAGGKTIEALRPLLNHFPARIRPKGQTMLEQIALFQSAGAKFHLTVASINVIAGLGVAVLMYFFAARAANISVPAGTLVWLCAIIYVLGRLPISIANLGVRELTLVGSLTIYGVEKPAALLMSMILFSALIVMAIIGAIYQLSWTATARKSAQSSSEPAT